MYHSLSKLLHETQAAAAKKLGILENTLAEDCSGQDVFMEHCPDNASPQPFEAGQESAPFESNGMLVNQEHQIG